MKKTLFFIFSMATALIQAEAQTCQSCGSLPGDSLMGDDIGPDFIVSLGSAQYGQSAGHLTFSTSLPDASLFTPVPLQFSAPTRTDVTVVTASLVTTNVTSVVASEGVIVTNLIISTNCFGVVTDAVATAILVDVTNLVATVATNTVVRQVDAPEALADIPPSSSLSGYVINFYYGSQVGGTNSDGTYTVSGTPFITWMITNSDSSSINQLQISEFGNVPDYGLMKQWTYVYSTNTGSWSMQTMGGIQETMITTNLNAGAYQTVNTLQYSGGAVTKQVRTTYTNFSGGQVALFQTATGSDGAPQITTYTYYDPNSFGAGPMPLVEWVTHPDGSWQWYVSYDDNRNPTVVYSAFGDSTVDNWSDGARETDYSYDPGVVSGSGDDGTINPSIPRQVVEYVQWQDVEVSRRYTAFLSVGVRLDIQCTTPGAAWNSAGNLVTTNLFYTNGPNQFLPEAIIFPDGTMTAYNYITNGTYRTNIMVTGQPDPTYTYIVDGTSNRTVLNQWGYTVSSASWDVRSGLPLSQDTYANFDTNGRPQQVTHLDSTTEYTYYTCCVVDYTADRDGVTNIFLYDTDKRQFGYTKFFNNQPISYENVLDAAGRTVESYRVGSDSSTIVLGQYAYDLAGELIAQTNALGGVTIYTRANDPTTGGLIRTAVYPNGGTMTNFYYADGSLKEAIGTATHGKAYGYGTGTDVNGNACTYTAATNLNTDGSLSSEWTQTFSDMAGRTTEILYADGHYSQSFYNSQGQLWKQIDPDGVITLYQYNAKDELAYTAVDLNQNGIIDFSGTDRINQTTNDVTTDYSTTVRRTRNYSWLDGQSSGTLVSSTESSTDGLNTWQTQYRDTSTAATTHMQTSYSSPNRTVTTTAPDNSYTVSTYSYGRLVSAIRYDCTGTQIGGTTYGYDAHGRQNTVIDARNGTTTLGFNNADLVATNTTPNPGGGSAEITTTTYNNMMQATSVMQPDGTTVNSVYLLTGELGLQYGSRMYPVAYSYNYAGRMQTMTNWSNFGGGTGARVTTWNYNAYRGFLTSKTYDGGATGPSYTYTGAGRLQTRTWVRTAGGQSLATTYGYDSAGGLASVVYSDGTTPNASYTYDRLGRQSTITCNGMTDTLTYNLANELLSESFSGGTLGGLSVTNGYDAYLRRTNLSALSTSSQLLSANYAYDNASRLSTVSDGNNNSAVYTYLANSPLVSQIVFKQSGTTRMTTTKQYDYLNRLTSISSVGGASSASPISFNYNYNPANQRTKDTLADSSYWIYGYDSLGQVTNGCKFFADGTPVAGQQFDYTFDTIGNRVQTQSGGDQTGANLRVANYSANNLNQITQRDVPGDVDVMGASILTNAVTVNGQTAYRKQEYFRQQLGVNNSSSALWTNMIVSGGQSVTGNVYVARTPEQFSYDADGNLTNDGRWAYTWDAENQLVKMTVNTNVGPQYQLAFAYDSKGRRIQKIVATNSVGIYTNNFLYDGGNLVAEVAPNDSLIRSYVWGNDLAGSIQSAGGVGGLLEVSYYGSTTTNCFVANDGNGNVSALINAADGTSLANYDYGPFGEVIRVTGPMAKANPFRFSTVYYDDEDDICSYIHRPYKPSTGTWLCKDPLGEPGFNLIQSGGKAASDPQMDQLLEVGLQSLRNKDRAAFLKWLSDLAIRQDAKQPPYEKSDDEEKANQFGSFNLYDFNNNDAVDKVDKLGLYTYTFYYPCLNPCCSFSACVIVLTTDSRWPRHPFLLWRCLRPNTLAMDLSCAVCSRSGFNYGCDGAHLCLWAYW
jgi:RHS repeat-associated protein